MSIGYRNSIARWYFYITPLFILLDYFGGVNVRVSALDSWPLYKNLYYGFCILCGICMYIVPRYSVVVALFESTINFMMIVLGIFVPYVQNILYVDDDQDMIDSARLVFEANGFIMEEALNTESGVQKYKECCPDFVIVDLMMEDVDSGIHCVKELKHLGNKAPVFMLSSIGDGLYSTIDISELELAGVFQKPFDVLYQAPP